MLVMLIAMYLWAGATVAFALWMFETIGQAMNGLLPEEKHLKKLRGNPGVMVILFAVWPIVLPMWAFIERKERSNV